MKVVVVGSGAIGCYIGGRLASVGQEVWLIGRNKLEEELSKNHGVTLIDLAGKETHVEMKTLHFATSCARVPEFSDSDIILIAVKSGDTESTAQELSSLALRSGTIVVSLQNGVSNPKVLKRILPECQIIWGMVGFNVVWTSNARFQNTSSNPLSLEKINNPKLIELSKLLVSAGVEVLFFPPKLMSKTHLEENIEGIAWSKLLINIGGCIGALSGYPVKRMLQNPTLRYISASCISEGILALKAAGIPSAPIGLITPSRLVVVLSLPSPIFTLISPIFLKVDANAKASIHVDLDSGKKTEIDYLNGEIVKLANRVNEPCPVNSKLVELMKEAEKSGKSPEIPPAEVGLKERSPWGIYIFGLLAVVVALWFVLR